MNRNRKMIWAVIWVVAIILVVFLSSKKQIAKKTTSPSSLSVTPSASLPETPSPSQQLQWGRDPFVRQPMSSLVGGGRLTGIILDENEKEKSYAIIDNQLVKVGEQVNGATVTQIEKGSVTLEVNGKKEELFLNQEEREDES